MMTFETDEDNDFVVGKDGNLSLVRDEKALLNICKNYALAKRGEMLHKKDKGIPFFGSVFGPDTDLDLFEAFFRERMREIDGVIEVVSFNAEIIDNTVNYTAIIRTKYGLSEVSNANL